MQNPLSNIEKYESIKNNLRVKDNKEQNPQRVTAWKIRHVRLNKWRIKVTRQKEKE